MDKENKINNMSKGSKYYGNKHMEEKKEKRIENNNGKVIVQFKIE